MHINIRQMGYRSAAITRSCSLCISPFPLYNNFDPGYGNRDMTLREPYYAALVIGYHSQTGELRPLKSLALKVRLAVKRPRKQSLIEYLVPC
jgi:hypothetical protein